MIPNPASSREREPESPELDDEDRLDLQDALAALQAFQESGEASVPYAEVRRRLGLT